MEQHDIFIDVSDDKKFKISDVSIFSMFAMKKLTLGEKILLEKESWDTIEEIAMYLHCMNMPGNTLISISLDSIGK